MIWGNKSDTVPCAFRKEFRGYTREWDIPTLSTWCKFAPGRFGAKSHFSTWCKFAPGRIILVPTVCRIDSERKSHKISHKIVYLKYLTIKVNKSLGLK
jgi:hypothetical protein